MKNISFICCISSILGSLKYNDLLKKVETNISEISEIMGPSNWIAPEQYKNEMGEYLDTEIWILKDFFSERELVKVKQRCMYFESATSNHGSRLFNLNPGYLSTKGMFLLTHKPNRNRKRIQVFDKIWKEKQLSFDNGFFYPTSNIFSEYLNKNRIFKFNSLINQKGPNVGVINYPKSELLKQSFDKSKKSKLISEA